MSDRPKFTPSGLPPARPGGMTSEDYAAWPHCEACDIPGAVDVTDRLCLSCWRILQVVRIALRESVGDRGRLTYVPKDHASK